MAHGRVWLGVRDGCQVSALHHQSLGAPIPPQENQWGARGLAGFWDCEWKEKHLSFQREKDQERQEHIAFCKKKKSAFTAYVYTNIYFQGCSESNIIREKNKTGFKERVRNMLNNPPNENQVAPGSNKIFIIFLSLQRSVITLPINSCRWKQRGEKWSEFVPWVTTKIKKQEPHSHWAFPTSKVWRTESTAECTAHVGRLLRGLCYSTILLLESHKDYEGLEGDPS